MTHRSNVREAARGTGLILVGVLVGQALEYGVRFALARGLGPDGFGAFSQARALFLSMAAFASLGLGLGVKRFVTHERHAGREALARRAYRDGSRATVVSSVAGGALLFALAEPLAEAFRNPDLVAAIRVLAFGVPFFVGLEYITRVAEAFRSFRPSVVARFLLEPALRFVSMVSLLAFGASLSVLFGALVASSAIAFVVAVILARRLDGLRETGDTAAPSQLGALLRFSLPLSMAGALFGFAERVDVLMIGLYRPEADVGLYAAASAISRIPLLLAAAMMPVFSTLAAEAVGRGDHAEIGRLLRLACRWMLIFALPLLVAATLYADGALGMLFGREYASAAPTLRWLVLAYTLPVLAGPVGLLLDALGKTHWSLGNMIVRTALNVALNAVLIPRWGISGAAIATCAALAITIVLLRLQLGGLMDLGRTYADWTRPLAVLAVAAAVSFGVASSVPDIVLSSLVGGVVLLAVFAAGMRFVPGCLREGDLEVVASLRARLGK